MTTPISASRATTWNVQTTTVETLSVLPPDWPAAGVMHFRLEEPRLGRLDLSCDTGYVVRSYEFGFPEIREVVFPNALDDGTFDFTRYIGARSVTLDIVLRPTDSPGSIADVRVESAMRDALLRYVHPWSRSRLYFSEHGDTRVRYFDLRGVDAGVVVNRPRFNEVAPQWKAPRGIMETLDVIHGHVEFRELMMDEYVFVVVNPGNAPAHWAVHMEGDLDDPTLSLDGTQHLTLHTALTPAGSDVDVDSYTRTVSVNGVATGYTYLDDQTTWFVVPPGESTLTMTHGPSTRIGYPFGTWSDSTWAAPAGDPSNNPPPGGAAPWAWSTRIDPATGLPGVSVLGFSLFPAWV